MTEIIIGTTPTITYKFNTVSPSDITERVCIVYNYKRHLSRNNN